MHGINIETKRHKLLMKYLLNYSKQGVYGQFCIEAIHATGG